MTDDVKAEIARQVRAGKTLRQIAVRAGIDTSVLYRFVGGRRMSLDNIDRLIDSLGMRLVRRRKRNG